MASLYITILSTLVILLIIASVKARFNAQAEFECGLLENEPITNEVIVNESMMQHLPPLVKRWLIGTGILGKPLAQIIRLKQKGILLISSKAKWMSFKAIQCYTVNKPQFV